MYESQNSTSNYVFQTQTQAKFRASSVFDVSNFNLFPQTATVAAAAAELRLAASDAINSSAVFYLDPNVKTGLAKKERESCMQANLKSRKYYSALLTQPSEQYDLIWSTAWPETEKGSTLRVITCEPMVVCRMGLIIKSWMPPPAIGRPSAQWTRGEFEADKPCKILNPFCTRVILFLDLTDKNWK